MLAWRQDITGWTLLDPAWGGEQDCKLSPLSVAARRKAEECPNDTAMLFDDGTSVTFKEVYQEAVNLAVAMQDGGLRAGDRVSAQLPNWREFVVINIACCLLNVVINPIGTIYRAKELQHIIKDSGAKMMFVPETFRGHNHVDMMLALRDQFDDLSRIVAVRPRRSAKDLEALGILAYADLVSGDQEPDCDFREPAKQGIKMLMYTSGTTGPAKGVLHSHSSLLRVVENTTEVHGIGEGDVFFMASPVTHITGYLACELPFFSGCKSAFMEVWDKTRAVRFAESVKATFSVGATPFLQELLDECTAQGVRLDSMRRYICGGASVPPDLIRRAHKLFLNCRCSRVYGSTETPLVSQGFFGLDQETNASETDGLIYGYQVKAVDKDGKSLPVGQEGEILVRGPSSFVGYTSKKATEESFSEDGFFKTGDLGVLDSVGGITITGRKKDLIIRGGENISAKEIEDVLHRHPLIAEAAVVSMPHARLGEGVAAYVRLVEGASEIRLEQVAEFVLSSGLARQKCPERLEVVDDFPRTASGKIRKDQLREDIRRKLRG